MESIIALVIMVLVLGFVGMPLLRDRKPEEDALAADGVEQDTELGRLWAQKETALAAIRELEFDHAVGSLSDGDYQQLKERYERKAIGLLKTLDEIGEAGTNGSSAEPRRGRAKAARARRGERRASRGPVCPECGEPYVDEDLFCVSCGAELGIAGQEGLACPECGEPYEEGDAFCASCGAHLLTQQEKLDVNPDYAPEDQADEGGEDGSRNEPARGAYQAGQPAKPGFSPRRKRNRRGGRQTKVSGNGSEAR